MLNEIYRMLDPVAFAVGPFVVRWYGIAYVAGFVCAALVLWQVAKRWKVRVDADSLLTVVLCAIVGVILGGRLGYVLVYGDGYYFSHPAEILAFNHGGMSFHGGLIGALLSGIVAARFTGIPYLTLADMGCIAAPIGLFFGRCANFVNGELWGAPTSLPSSLAALRGPARGRRVVLRAVHPVAQATAASAGDVFGRVPGGLRPVPLPYRVRSPARCADRLPVGRVVDYGPGPQRAAHGGGSMCPCLCRSR